MPFLLSRPPSIVHEIRYSEQTGEHHGSKIAGSRRSSQKRDEASALAFLSTSHAEPCGLGAKSGPALASAPTAADALTRATLTEKFGIPAAMTPTWSDAAGKSKILACLLAIQAPKAFDGSSGMRD